MRFAASERVASVLRRSGVGVHPLEWRLPPIETYPWVVAFVQTWKGKLVLFAVFAALMKPLHNVWFEMTAAAIVVSLAGRYRRYVAVLATGAMLVRIPYWFGSRPLDELIIEQAGIAGAIVPEHLRVATLIGCVPLAAASIWLARHFRNHPLGRRPILLQHVLCFALLALATSHLLRGLPQVVLWSVTITFIAYFWFLAFALMDQRHRAPAPTLLHFATFHPFFAPGTPVPMGRGGGNLKSVEAQTAEELAVTQLKGLKLLVWAFCLKALLFVSKKAIYGLAGLAPLGQSLEQFVENGQAPGPFAIVSLIVNFPEQLLATAIWGHIIIATARLAGFRLLRNTWRPLSSRTVAEFWNRYFYYFKEVLVHVYFYPTYIRWFKTHPRLRLAFATFIAAGMGNFLFHYILAARSIVEVGLVEALVRSQTYAFYCFLLAAGIIVSQLRARKFDPDAGWLRRQLVPSLGVAAFFCFLTFFDGPGRHVTLARHFEFLFHVFGIHGWTQAIS